MKRKTKQKRYLRIKTNVKTTKSIEAIGKTWKLRNEGQGNLKFFSIIDSKHYIDLDFLFFIKDNDKRWSWSNF